MADTQANLKLIEQVTLDWVKQQYDDILQHVSDNAVYEVARGILEKVSPLFGTFRGKTSIGRWYDENRKAAEGQLHIFCGMKDMGKFIATGDQVVSYGTMTKTRTEPACDWVAIWTLKDSMIEHCWLVMDTAATMEKLKQQKKRKKPTKKAAKTAPKKKKK